MCENRLPFTANIEPLCGISIASLAQISIYFNIPSSTVAATTVPLPHKDFFKIGGRLLCGVVSQRDSAAAHFSTKLSSAERAKVVFLL